MDATCTSHHLESYVSFFPMILYCTFAVNSRAISSRCRPRKQIAATGRSIERSRLPVSSLSTRNNLEITFSPLTTTTIAAVPPAESASTLPYSTPATPTFDAVLPDTTILIGFGIILIVCAIAANVWANQVVPISRTKLAIAKQKNSNSTLRQYLDELLEIENDTSATRLTATNGTTTAAATEIMSSTLYVDDKADRDVHGGENVADDLVENELRTNASSGRFKGDRVFERWLFSDWLVKDSKVRKGGRQKEPAIPILKSAKWNSGDNPVLVATTLIFLGVLLTSVTERITTMLPT